MFRGHALDLPGSLQAAASVAQAGRLAGPFSDVARSDVERIDAAKPLGERVLREPFAQPSNVCQDSRVGRIGSYCARKVRPTHRSKLPPDEIPMEARARPIDPWVEHLHLRTRRGCHGLCAAPPGCLSGVSTYVVGGTNRSPRPRQPAAKAEVVAPRAERTQGAALCAPKCSLTMARVRQWQATQVASTRRAPVRSWSRRLPRAASSRAAPRSPVWRLGPRGPAHCLPSPFCDCHA
jgi:hypothetical protein